MLWILSEARSLFHGRDDARLPFDSQIRFNPTLLGHQADSGGRLRRVQAIHDKHPRCFRSECDSALHVGNDIFFSPGGSHGRRNHVPGCHLNVRDQRLGAMTTVGTFHSFHASRRPRVGRMGTFKSLNTRLLIRADHVHPVLSPWVRVLRQPTDGLYGLVTVLRVLCPFMIEPVT